jgi:hypothetical protein
MVTRIPAFAWRALRAAAPAVAFAVLATPASAQIGLRSGLFGEPAGGPGRASPPAVARYVSQSGDGFILDRTQTRPLLKFDGSPELWVLRPQPAPRGDVIYKNDLGEPVLRVTRLGGLTLFTPDRPGGSPVALAGGGQPLRLRSLTPQALLERLLQASIRASRAAGRTIEFSAPNATPGSSALLADAASVTAFAVERIAQKPQGRAILLRVNRVSLVEGRKAEALLRKGEIRITISATDGIAGRPSSDRILAAAGAR